MAIHYANTAKKTEYDSKKELFNRLVLKYPYQGESQIGLQMKLSGGLKPVLPSRNTICFSPADAKAVVIDMIDAGLFFIEIQTKAKTERGMFRFLSAQFSKKLKSF